MLHMMCDKSPIVIFKRKKWCLLYQLTLFFVMTIF